MILDVSEWQVPISIDYDELSKELELVIVRVQYGSNYEDLHFRKHIVEFQKRNIPVAVYAWVRGVSIADMKLEAIDFYNRASQFNPCFWFLDVEEFSMPGMRGGVTAYVEMLRELKVSKIGVYVANHLYQQFNLDLSKVDAVWIPSYGLNSGYIETVPNYSCDIHQYTSEGKTNGYSGSLDMNRLMGIKPLEYFTNSEIGKKRIVVIKKEATHYVTGELIPEWVKGNEYEIKEIRVSNIDVNSEEVLLSSINSWVFSKDLDNYQTKKRLSYFVVEGDTLWEISEKVYGDGNRYEELKKINSLPTDIIYPGQEIYF